MCRSSMSLRFQPAVVNHIFSCCELLSYIMFWAWRNSIHSVFCHLQNSFTHIFPLSISLTLPQILHCWGHWKFTIIPDLYVLVSDSLPSFHNAWSIFTSFGTRKLSFPQLSLISLWLTICDRATRVSTVKQTSQHLVSFQFRCWRMSALWHITLTSSIVDNYRKWHGKRRFWGVFFPRSPLPYSHISKIT